MLDAIAGFAIHGSAISGRCHLRQRATLAATTPEAGCAIFGHALSGLYATGKFAICDHAFSKLRHVQLRPERERAAQFAARPWAGYAAFDYALSGLHQVQPRPERAAP
jgi:hypothetical protein